MELRDIIPVEAQEQLINSGFSMNKKVLQADNCHDLIHLEKEMSTLYQTFALSVAITHSEDRMDILLAGDTVDLIPNGNKIEVKVKGTLMKGMQRSYLIKKLIEENGIIDTYSSHDWEIYVFIHNGHLLQAGFMSTEYGIVSYLRKYYARNDYNEPTSEEYYQVWKDKRKTQRSHTYTEAYHPTYGDAATGLGSIYTDQIHDQLDEILALVRQIADEPEYSEQLDDLRDMLDNSDEW